MNVRVFFLHFLSFNLLLSADLQKMLLLPDYIHFRKHPSIFLTRSIPFRLMGLPEPVLANAGQSRGTPWTGRQAVTGF